MKCQRCDKSATFHITELTGGKPQELHLCEEHAVDQVVAVDDSQPARQQLLLDVVRRRVLAQPTAAELHAVLRHERARLRESGADVVEPNALDGEARAVERAEKRETRGPGHQCAPQRLHDH